MSSYCLRFMLFHDLFCDLLSHAVSWNTQRSPRRTALQNKASLIPAVCKPASASTADWSMSSGASANTFNVICLSSRPTCTTTGFILKEPIDGCYVFWVSSPPWISVLITPPGPSYGSWCIFRADNWTNVNDVIFPEFSECSVTVSPSYSIALLLMCVYTSSFTVRCWGHYPQRKIVPSNGR